MYSGVNEQLAALEKQMHLLQPRLDFTSELHNMDQVTACLIFSFRRIGLVLHVFLPPLQFRPSKRLYVTVCELVYKPKSASR